MERERKRNREIEREKKKYGEIEREKGLSCDVGTVCPDRETALSSSPEPQSKSQKLHPGELRQQNETNALPGPDVRSLN